MAKRFRKDARKRHRKPSRRERPQSWAFSFRPEDAELSHLSSEARAGLYYARRIAFVGLERRLSALQDGPSPEPLTVERLAKEEQTSPVLVHTAIKQARIEIFGRDLKDAAIYYRLRKRRERRERGERLCAEPGCGRRIPALANGRRRYCDLHGSGAARVRRHRAKASILSTGESAG